jgi:hypothetical protein
MLEDITGLPKGNGVAESPVPVETSQPVHDTVA